MALENDDDCFPEIHVTNNLPDQLPASSPPSRTLKYRWLAKFESPQSARVPTLVDSSPLEFILDTGSTRNLISSQLLVKIKGPQFLHQLLKKRVKPILDLNGQSVRVKGCFSGLLQIGPFCEQVEFHVFDSDQDIAVLGYIFCANYGILCHPAIGLIQECQDALYVGARSATPPLSTPAIPPPPATPVTPSLHQTKTPDFAQLPATQLATDQNQVLIKVRSVQEVLLSPHLVSSVRVRLDLAHLHPADRVHFRHFPLVFHSENLEQQLPLDQLSVIHQFVYVDPNFRTIIRYSNKSADHSSWK